MNATPIVRIFNGSDAYMAQEARIIHGLIESDLSRFTAFDSTFSTESQIGFLTAITAADTVVADTSVTDQLKTATEQLEAAMEAARTKYAEVRYFALKAFPDSSGIQGEFGLNDYANVRKVPSRMIQFLDELYKTANKYEAKLTAAGCSTAALTEIKDIRSDLIGKNTVQKTFKRERPKLTEDRIAILNECYNRLTQANAAAKLVYAGDYAKQKQFVYQPSSKESDDVYTGEVAAADTVGIADIPWLADRKFTFKNTGVAPLVFCLSASAEIEGIEVAIGGGAIISKTASDLNPNATKLLVRNSDAATAGSYEVEVA